MKNTRSDTGAWCMRCFIWVERPWQTDVLQACQVQQVRPARKFCENDTQFPCLPRGICLLSHTALMPQLGHFRRRKHILYWLLCLQLNKMSLTASSPLSVSLMFILSFLPFYLQSLPRSPPSQCGRHQSSKLPKGTPSRCPALSPQPVGRPAGCQSTGRTGRRAEGHHRRWVDTIRN